MRQDRGDPSEDEVRVLREKARHIRLETIRLIEIAKVGHYSSVFSCAEIFAALYYDVMRLRPGEPAWPDRDRFLMGKGHAAVGLFPVLADHGGALRPALLTQRLGRERERLVAQRLRPEALLQRIEHARGRVEALDRLRRSLDPEAPLQRGYVLVTDRDGHVVKDRATAAAREALTLKFADGTLDVTAGEVSPAQPPAAARPASRPRGTAESVQPKLL